MSQRDATPETAGLGRRTETVFLTPGVRRFLDRIVALAVPLAIWQLAAEYVVDPKWVSSPALVADHAWAMAANGSLQVHMAQTFWEAILGLVIGVVTGTLFGILLGRMKRLSEAVDPLVMCLYSLPRVALAPLFIIWLGIGLSAKVALVVSIVFFIVLFNVREGIKTIDQDIIDSFRVMNASRMTMMRHVILPSLVPWIMTSVRIGIGMALIGAVVAEMMGSSRGLGWYVINATSIYDMTGAITAVVILGIMAMALNFIVGWVDRKVLYWRRDNSID